jgi:SH3 domain protein
MIKAKGLRCLLAALLLATQGIAAEPVHYIRDVVHVPLRTGDSNQHRILANLESGTALTVLAQGRDGFVRVRTEGGTVGWLEQQYLVRQPIARERLAQAQAALEKARADNAELREQLQTLRGARDESRQEAQTLARTSESLQAELDEIRRISAGAIELQQRYQAASAELAALQQQARALEVENAELQEQHNQRAFIHGALAVGLGCLIVLITPRLWPRRRRSEWA